LFGIVGSQGVVIGFLVFKSGPISHIWENLTKVSNVKIFLGRKFFKSQDKYYSYFKLFLSCRLEFNKGVKNVIFLNRLRFYC
jgi:hypothetical protein